MMHHRFVTTWPPGYDGLKLAMVRTQPPEILEVLHTAKTQRWSFEEVQRTLVAI